MYDNESFEFAAQGSDLQTKAKVQKYVCFFAKQNKNPKKETKIYLPNC